MYAIVEEGGRQYQVSVGQSVQVNRLTAEPGQEIVLGRVILVKDESGVKAGPGLLSGITVTGKVTRLLRGPKIRVFKKKRRKGYHKLKGHRQDLTEVLVTSIGEAGLAPRLEEASEPESSPEQELSAEPETSAEQATSSEPEASPEPEASSEPETSPEQTTPDE
ncbi:MAG: 50S ribosomal protein L21 [Deltaproteobacteria bacterium]|jgi:large subunit ribosomal protein L21|nr:50S ribosomal protein L21 [Deltaproteobacteria bacterium]